MQFGTTTTTHNEPTQNFHNIILPMMMSNKTQHQHQQQIQVNTNNPWQGFPKAGLGAGSSSSSSSSFGDANCMEQLLVHCANAIESNDVTLAQQILWVLNNIAPPDGDANQRLACGFLRALVSRAARAGTPAGCRLLAAAVATAAAALADQRPHRFSSAVELAGFIDLTPWHRFGFTAANAAILRAAGSGTCLHVLDLGLTHCMQFPTLVDALAALPDPPPLLRITTVVSEDSHHPPALEPSYDELGLRLVNFARSRNVALDFRVVRSSHADGFASLIGQLHVLPGEALVVNCHMKLHYVPEETSAGPGSVPLRTLFLKALRSLDPAVVVLVDEDADLTSNNLVSRLRSAFNYLWIPYDTVDTFLPRGSKQRQWYEADICWRIENVVASEGPQRVERLEPKAKWAQRMRAVGFRGVGFGDEAVAEVKAMLDEHAAGWGVKRDEDDLVLTWKGHNVVFATVWLPA